MKLCVTGRHDLDTLESWARGLFASVDDKNVTVPDLGAPAAYDASNLGQLFRFVPVKDKDILSLVWYLPPTDRESTRLSRSSTTRTSWGTRGRTPSCPT